MDLLVFKSVEDDKVWSKFNLDDAAIDGVSIHNDPSVFISCQARNTLKAS